MTKPGIAKRLAVIGGVLAVFKVQPGDYNNVIVIEFKDQAAFDRYADNPAHREWEKVYLPVREESRTHDVTN
ncbi:MAG: Dabb family protein [Bryobacteraceae bacterium]